MPAKARNKTELKTAATPKAKKKTASPQDFKKKAKNRVELELPSGAAIIARGLSSMTTFLKSGMIPNGLLSVVQESIDSGVEPNMDQLLQADDEGNVSQESLAEMLTLVDNVTVACWVLPPVALPPEDDDDRSAETLYTDEVSDDDKLFVLQWAIGGTSNLEQFRKEQNTGMDRLRASEDVENIAK